MSDTALTPERLAELRAMVMGHGEIRKLLDAAEELEAARAENAALEERIADLETERGILRGGEAALRAEVERLAYERDDACRALDLNAEIIESLKADRDVALAAAEQLREHIDRCESSWRAAADDRDDAGLLAESLGKENAALRAEVRRLRERVAELEAGLRPFAGVGIPDNWPADRVLTWECSLDTKGRSYAHISYVATDGPGPTVGDYRRAAALLAKGSSRE